MGTPDDTTNIQTIFDLYPHFLKHPARYHSHDVPFGGCDKTTVFNLPDNVLHKHTKKNIYIGIKFGDLGGQAISAPLSIQPPGIL